MQDYRNTFVTQFQILKSDAGYTPLWRIGTAPEEEPVNLITYDAKLLPRTWEVFGNLVGASENELFDAILPLTEQAHLWVPPTSFVDGGYRTRRRGDDLEDALRRRISLACTMNELVDVNPGLTLTATAVFHYPELDLKASKETVTIKNSAQLDQWIDKMRSEEHFERGPETRSIDGDFWIEWIIVPSLSTLRSPKNLHNRKEGEYVLAGRGVYLKTLPDAAQGIEEEWTANPEKSLVMDRDRAIETRRKYKDISPRILNARLCHISIKTRARRNYGYILVDDDGSGSTRYFNTVHGRSSVITNLKVKAKAFASEKTASKAMLDLSKVWPNKITVKKVTIDPVSKKPI